MSAITAAQLSATYDHVSLYTFGEPRTGNQAYASYMHEAFDAASPETTRNFRVTHTNDGIPNLPPAELGTRSSAARLRADRR
jgi:hypothetical protein